MQNDLYSSSEEVEPRTMPQPASNFDTRPFPMVPEVSLVMDKPQQLPKQTSGYLSNSAPDSGHLYKRDNYNQSGETYAAWRDKKYPHQLVSTPSPIHSSTQNASNLQDNYGYRQSFKSHNTEDFRNHQFSDNSYGNQPQRNYVNSQRSGLAENSNKYTSNYLTNNNGNDHRVNSNYNQALRSSSERNRINSYSNRWSDERIWTNDNRQTDQRRWSDERRIPSDEKKQCGRPQALEAFDLIHKLRQQRSSLYPSSNSCTRRSPPVEYDCPSNPKPVQHAHSNQDHYHHQSGCCTMNHTNHNSTTETETVRNLLQVITSQNEQIKSLQKQLDRMIKLHEQSLRNKNQCTCQSTINRNEMLYQNPHLYDQSRNNNLPVSQNNMMRENDRCLSDLKLQDDRTKKTIVEQKVSIGVMTSFELKVQNNPSMTSENDNKSKASQEKSRPSLETSNMVKNLVNDTGEMIKRKNNFFTPTPLENISEGSESHMSSLRQSHLCSDSTKQSIEANDCAESTDVRNSKTNSHNRDNDKPTNSESNKQNWPYEENRYTPSSDHDKRKEPVFEENKNNFQETASQYDFQFQDVRSSQREDFPKENNSDGYNSEPLITDMEKRKNTKCDNFVDECLSLSESELDVEDPSPPSPEPSIHLDMQEFSSDAGSLPPQQATKVGWTLYNNVLDQVNQILQNSPLNENRDQESPDGYRDNEKIEYDNNFIMDTVKAATLDQLTKLGISFSENVDQRKPAGSKRVMFDASYYPKQGQPEANMGATASSFETNTSMHMKALARKYLNEEQLAEVAVQKTQTGALRQTSSGQNTNMSFATMHYLQRYHLLPGNNSSPTTDVPRDDYRNGPIVTERLAMRTAERREPSPRRYQAYAGASKVSFPSKILDISTLKQQPKLL